MYELRENAQLPWRMIAQALGIKYGSYAGAYYRRLQKIYAPHLSAE